MANSKKRVLKSWLDHCKSKDGEERFKQTLREAQPVFRVLTETIDNLIAQNNKDRLKMDMYECPNWAQKHADSIGEERALEKVKDILRNSLTN